MTTTLDDQQLVDASYLGKLIGRSTKSIKVDVSRRPDTLPPRYQIPGTRKLQWRVKDIRDWMDAMGEIMTEQRMAARKAAREYGGTVSLTPLHIASKDLGAAATNGMKGSA